MLIPDLCSRTPHTRSIPSTVSIDCYLNPGRWGFVHCYFFHTSLVSFSTITSRTFQPSTWPIHKHTWPPSPHRILSKTIQCRVTGREINGSENWPVGRDSSAHIVISGSLVSGRKWYNMSGNNIVCAFPSHLSGYIHGRNVWVTLTTGIRMWMWHFRFEYSPVGLMI